MQRILCTQVSKDKEGNEEKKKIDKEKRKEGGDPSPSQRDLKLRRNHAKVFRNCLEAQSLDDDDWKCGSDLQYTAHCG